MGQSYRPRGHHSYRQSLEPSQGSANLEGSKYRDQLGGFSGGLDKTRTKVRTRAVAKG